MSRLRNKRGRPSNYRKSLKDNPYWEKVRRKVKIRDKFQCLICGSKIRLEIHHITYFLDGKSVKDNEIQYLEWLITLCEKDHEAVHKDNNHPLNPKNNNKLNINDFKQWQENQQHLKG